MNSAHRGWRRRLVATLVAAATGTTLAATTANAWWVSGQSWGTITSAFGQAYGAFWNESNTQARLGSHFRRTSGTDRVYTDNTGYSWYQDDGRVAWGGSWQSAYTSSSSWVYDWDARTLHGDAHGVRSVDTEICKERAFQPDPCSDAKAQPYFSY
ncbi:hypothetical protein GCM10027053_27910 [Intrasporangium mesophilum]